MSKSTLRRTHSRVSECSASRRWSVVLNHLQLVVSSCRWLNNVEISKKQQKVHFSWCGLQLLSKRHMPWHVPVIWPITEPCMGATCLKDGHRHLRQAWVTPFSHLPCSVIDTSVAPLWLAHVVVHLACTVSPC